MEASFKQLINEKVIKRADAMKIRYQDIHIEPGFNLRDETDEFHAGVRELADYIKVGGVYPPLEVRIRPQGGVWVVDGHRRHAALGIAIAEGCPIDWVEIRQFVGNDADRTARIITSAKGYPLSVIEVARGYRRLAAFGLSSTEIGNLVNKTRTHVESLLLLANAPTSVQKQVSGGEVAASTAISVLREHGEEASEVLDTAVQAAKSAGKKKATTSTIKGKAVSQGQIKIILTRVGSLFDALPEGARDALAAAQDAADGASDQIIPVPARQLAELMQAKAAVDARTAHVTQT